MFIRSTDPSSPLFNMSLAKVASYLERPAWGCGGMTSLNHECLNRLSVQQMRLQHNCFTVDSVVIVVQVSELSSHIPPILPDNGNTPQCLFTRNSVQYFSEKKNNSLFHPISSQAPCRIRRPYSQLAVLGNPTVQCRLCEPLVTSNRCWIGKFGRHG